MPKYKVTYSESQIREIYIEAESPDEAEQMVKVGYVEYDESRQLDATVMDVNSVELIKE